MKPCIVLSSVAAAMLFAAPPADAATVGVETGELMTQLDFGAAPGEANRVVVRITRDSAHVIWTVSDTGAVLTAGQFCQALDAHTARCALPSAQVSGDIPGGYFVLGDMDDRFAEDMGAGAYQGYVIALGGLGNDRLIGSDSGDDLDGGPGHDRLIGRGGDDWLRRAAGFVSCGRGDDTVVGGGSSRDFLQPDCEVLESRWGFGGSPISAYPVAPGRRSITFRVTCPSVFYYDLDFEAPGRCGPGTLSLREVGASRRTLARGHYPAVPARVLDGRLVHARLTALGRRLATRRHGVRARVRISGYYTDPEFANIGLHAVRWTIRLKVPR